MSDRTSDTQIIQWRQAIDAEQWPSYQESWASGMVDAIEYERARADRAEADNYQENAHELITYLREQLETVTAQLKAVTEYHGCPADAHMDDDGNAVGRGATTR